MQKNGFYCPRCSGRVSNDDNSIVKLKGRLESSKFSVHFDIELPSQPGTYGAVFSEGVVLKKGAKLDFICPCCAADLAFDKSPNFACLKMVEEEDNEKMIFFNRIYGEHSSFVFDIESHKLIGSYGEESVNYKAEFNKDVNFFGF
jgi:hypothetical protein